MCSARARAAASRRSRCCSSSGVYGSSVGLYDSNNDNWTYAFYNLEDGSYYVRAFMDLDPQVPGQAELGTEDPRGRYGIPSAVTITSGSPQENKNITIFPLL